MTSVDIHSLLFRKRRGLDYNCLHFVDEAWLMITGVKLNLTLVNLKTSLNSNLEVIRCTKLTRKAQIQDPCIVFMTQLGRDPHVGVYYQNRVLHLHTNGPEYLPLEQASRGFTSIRYYA